MAGNLKLKSDDPWQAALYKAIEEKPLDSVSILALADWYEEQGQTEAAAALRWLAEQKKTPYRYIYQEELKVHFDQWKSGWYWWATDAEGHDWGHPDSCVLPHKLWSKLTHAFEYNPLVFREYPTIQGAIDAFIRAWTRKRPWYRRKKKNER